MNSRGRLARIKARAGLTDKPKVVAGGSDLKPIVASDFETGDLVHEFETIKAAIEAGFNKPNLIGALKNGRKYKGLSWAYAE